MKKLLPFWLVLAAVCFVPACSEGPVGPPGPPGRDANVFSINFVFSVADAAFNGPVASVSFDVPDITPSVVDNGAVMVYFREQGTWTAMPYTFADESPDVPAVDYTITLGYAFDDAFLEVFYEGSGENEYVLGLIEDQPDREMKAVIIDGFAAKTGVDLSDYEAVKAYYDLTD